MGEGFYAAYWVYGRPTAEPDLVCAAVKGPIFFRGGATHYSDGEGSLTIHMVRDFSLDC